MHKISASMFVLFGDNNQTSSYYIPLNKNLSVTVTVTIKTMILNPKYHSSFNKYVKYQQACLYCLMTIIKLEASFIS